MDHPLAQRHNLGILPCCGKMDLSMDMFTMCVRGRTMSGDTSFITKVSMWSIPVDLEFFSEFITFRPSSGVTGLQENVHCLSTMTSFNLARGSASHSEIFCLRFEIYSMNKEFMVPAISAGELISLPFLGCPYF